MPVLLADDDEGLRAAFARRLRTFTEVVTAATVDEAQELLASRNDWSAFLFDLRFGPSDLEGGIHLLAAARQRFASTPAFLVTGFMDPNVVLRAAALDARCWPKSLGREHFAQIAKILERERERDRAPVLLRPRPTPFRRRPDSQNTWTRSWSDASAIGVLRVRSVICSAPL
jgi:DNA-binding NarL/FixJ family response regulator